MKRRTENSGSRFAIITALFVMSLSAHAQNVPFLVKDIGTSETRYRDDIQRMAAPGNFILFDHTDPVNGRRIWRSDGTAQGTVPLEDNGDDPPHSLTMVNGKHYFIMGSTLWSCEGDPSTMRPVLRGVTNYPQTRLLAHEEGTLYLSSSEIDYYSFKLWKTDGVTSECLTMALHGGANWNQGSIYLAVLNHKLIFNISTEEYGSELWTSDFTSSGTQLLKDIYPGDYFYGPEYLAKMGDAVYFSASNHYVNNELWKTDGTTSGTVMVKDIWSGDSGSFPNSLLVMDGVLYFIAQDASHGYELWKSDGTESGTILVKDINPGTGASDIADLTVVNHQLFFSASDGVHGQELWVSDGTAAGTVMVQDGIAGATGSNPRQLTPFGDQLAYLGDWPGGGYALWLTDGSGTTMLRQLPIPGPRSLPLLANAAGTLFFIMDNAGLKELWKSDGTSLGTSLVKVLNEPWTDSNPEYLTEMGGKLFFTVTAQSGASELWRSDGTDAGTTRAQNDYPSPQQLFAFKDMILFTSTANPGVRLCRSSGRDGESTELRHFNAPSDTSLSGFFRYQDEVFFRRNNLELWKTDGTVSGTLPVTPLKMYGGPVEANNLLFFAGQDDQHGVELWTSDGTSSGTRMLKDIYPGWYASSYNSSVPRQLTVVGNKVFFIASSSINGRLLCVSDGTLSGTTSIIGRSRSYNDDAFGTSMAAYRGELFFSSRDTTHGMELWKSDGTTSGTAMVRDILPGSAGSGPQWLTVMGSDLYFFTTNGTQGAELWRSDGTEEGTRLVKAINPGPYNGRWPQNVMVAMNNLYFTAYDPDHGVELWTSDGTEAGTRRLGDIAPGSRDSNPERLTRAGDILFFRATNSTTNQGTELWALRLLMRNAVNSWMLFGE